MQGMSKALINELHRIVTILKDSYKPERIILFGSSVAEKGGEGSDLDLVIIKNTRERFYDRIGQVLTLIKPHEAIDILVYTPDEYEKLKHESWFVGEEIEKKGRVVYRAN